MESCKNFQLSDYKLTDRLLRPYFSVVRAHWGKCTVVSSSSNLQLSQKSAAWKQEIQKEIPSSDPRSWQLKGPQRQIEQLSNPLL